jgi:hypothetical protein
MGTLFSERSPKKDTGMGGEADGTGNPAAAVNYASGLSRQQRTALELFDRLSESEAVALVERLEARNRLSRPKPPLGLPVLGVPPAAVPEAAWPRPPGSGAEED